MRLPEDFSGVETDEEIVRLWLNGRPEGTRNIYLRTAKEFFLKTAPVGLRDMKVSHLVTWVEQLKGAPATQARVIGTVKSLFAFAHRTGYTVFDVGVSLRTPKVPSQLHKRIVDEETMQDILKAATSDRDRAIVRLFYGSGIRNSELCNLTFADIRGNRITVNGKGVKARTILLPEAIIKTLLKLRQKGDKDETPIFRSAYGRQFNAVTMWGVVTRITNESGTQISPHWFRHAHASHSLDNGAPIHLVSHCLGHANVATTSLYLHANPKDSSSRYVKLA